MNLSRTKKALLLLDLVLIAGLLAHSVILLTLNKSWDPQVVLGTEHAAAYLSWRKAEQAILSVCNLVYFVGHLVILLGLIVKDQLPVFRYVLLYFAVQAGLLVIGTIPFGLFDRAYFGDYIFQVWNTVWEVLLLLLGAGLGEIYARVKRRKPTV